jgi:hypothetical protein
LTAAPNRAASRKGAGGDRRHAALQIDRTFLTDALVLFDEIVETFPVRGDITAN